MSSCKASPILLIYAAGDAAADYGGSEGEQLRVRSEESLGQMLLGQRHASRSRLYESTQRGRNRPVVSEEGLHEQESCGL